VRSRLTADDYHGWTAAAICLLEPAFPDRPAEPANWPSCATLLPHVLAAVGVLEAAETAARATGDLCQRAAAYLIAIRAQQEPVLDLLGQALRLRSRAYGRGSYEVSETLISTARSLYFLGRVDKALQPASEAVAIRQRLGGSPGLVPALQMLADVLVEADRVAESVGVLEEALAICEAAPGGPDEATPDVLAVLGYSLWRNGDWPAARDTYARALAAYDAAGRPAPIERVVVSRRLGQVLQDLGDLHASEVRHREAQALALEYFGTDGVETVRAENGLGHILAVQGKVEEAERLQRHGVDFFTTSHPAWPLREESLILLAKTLVLAGKADESLQVAQEALASALEHRGLDHPYTAVVVRAVGAAERAQGNLEAATVSLERALAIYERAHGADFPAAAEIRTDLQQISQELAERSAAGPPVVPDAAGPPVVTD
jgi:tetratricopeptide (TPR) repeat protein